jgi:hypothetical protein
MDGTLTFMSFQRNAWILSEFSNAPSVFIEIDHLDYGQFE